MQDDLTDTEKEDIDRAIALSLSEQDQKGKQVVGMFYGFCTFICWFIWLRFCTSSDSAYDEPKVHILN